MRTHAHIDVFLPIHAILRFINVRGPVIFRYMTLKDRRKTLIVFFKQLISHFIVKLGVGGNNHL